MNKKFIILSVVSIILCLSGLYFFTDMFWTSEQKFIKEVEYYENLNYTIGLCHIDHYQLWLMSKNGVESHVELVSKEELCKIITRNTSRGFIWENRGDFNLGKADCELSWDNDSYVLWVYEYNVDFNEEWMIYWWTPLPENSKQ